jgi:hypothetical protein
MAGWTLVFGHEHIGRTLYGGRVIIVGNQFPSSVSDCIGDTDKHCLRIKNGSLQLEHTWSAHENYALKQIGEDLKIPDHYKFIRVIGEASAAESAEVIKAVSSCVKAIPPM